MIKGFSNETSPLNDYELRVLLPVILAGLKDKQGKRNAVTNGYIIGRLKQQGYRIDAPRLRKVINHIRTNDLIPGLIATSEGYFLAEDEQELMDYEDSLRGREEAIKAVRLAIARQRRMLYTEAKRRVIQQTLKFKFSMERELGKDIQQGEARRQFLADNADAVEKKEYMRHYTPEELLKLKESLSETCISINDIEEELKEVKKEYKDRLEPLLNKKKEALEGLKKKAELVEEDCYKFIDEDAKEVGYYNQNGDLIESRPAYSEEIQKTIFQVLRKNGTEDK